MYGLTEHEVVTVRQKRQMGARGKNLTRAKIQQHCAAETIESINGK